MRRVQLRGVTWETQIIILGNLEMVRWGNDQMKFTICESKGSKPDSDLQMDNDRS